MIASSVPKSESELESPGTAKRFDIGSLIGEEENTSIRFTFFLRMRTGADLEQSTERDRPVARGEESDLSLPLANACEYEPEMEADF